MAVKVVQTTDYQSAALAPEDPSFRTLLFREAPTEVDLDYCTLAPQTVETASHRCACVCARDMEGERRRKGGREGKRETKSAHEREKYEGRGGGREGGKREESEGGCIS